MFAGFWMLSANTLSQVQINSPLYKRIALNNELIGDILPPPEYILETYQVVLQILGETTQDDQKFNRKSQIPQMILTPAMNIGLRAWKKAR